MSIEHLLEGEGIETVDSKASLSRCVYGVKGKPTSRFLGGWCYQ